MRSPIMIMITFGLVGMGLTVASFIDSLESFGAIQSFINLPLFFLSGALFPVGAGSPNWLRIISSVNPLTYGIDGLRIVVLSSAWQPLQPFYLDLLVVSGFDVVMMIIGTYSFSRRRQFVKERFLGCLNLTLGEHCYCEQTVTQIY